MAGTVDAESLRRLFEAGGVLSELDPEVLLDRVLETARDMARTGAGLGLAPGIVDFEEIDRVHEQSARARAAEGVERARRAGLNAQPRTRARHTTIAEAVLAEADQVGPGRSSSGRAGSRGSSHFGWAACHTLSFSTPTGR